MWVPRHRTAWGSGTHFRERLLTFLDVDSEAFLLALGSSSVEDTITSLPGTPGLSEVMDFFISSSQIQPSGVIQQA